MNIIICALLTVSSLFSLAGQPPAAKIAATDLQGLTGAQWQGALTYRDYKSNKQVSIPANLTVTAATQDKLSWVFEFQYPDEPQANRRETVTLAPDGSTLSGETVIERTTLPDHTLKLVTEKAGQDNDKPATFRYTYVLSATNFSIKKEVKYEGTTDYFARNEYSWKR